MSPRWMKALMTGIALLISNIGAWGQVEVRTLLHNGSNGHRLNIVYLAEGYTEQQKLAFFQDAERLLQYSLAVFPYSAYARHFNAYAIFVPSTESGSDHPSRSVYRNTYFNSTYDTQGIARLVTLTGDGLSKVFVLLATYVPEYDFPVVIVNDTEYGGSGGRISVTSIHPSSGEIVVHEQGHTFAGLADEYDSAYPGWTPRERANSTQQTQLSSIEWRDWIDPLTPIPTPATQTYTNSVGLFEGCQYQTTGWYRPKLNCKMRTLNIAFCEVCSESHIAGLYAALPSIDSIAPGDDTVAVSIPDSIRLSVSLLEPVQYPLEVTWKLNGSRISGASGKALTLASQDLGPGTFTFEVEVTDTTSRVRNARLRPELCSTHAWTVNVLPVLVLSSPPNRATGVPTSPTFVWEAAPGATSYRVQVSQDSAFTTVVYDSSGIATTTHQVQWLSGNTKYYWRVAAADAGGTTNLSMTWSLTTQSGPYLGSRMILPGTIEVEHYDAGGEGISYHDTEAENIGATSGSRFRTAEGVDIEPCQDPEGGRFNIAWARPDEWLSYAIAIPQSGTYRMDARVATPLPGRFHLELDGNDITGPVCFGATGGWQSWVTVRDTVILPSGDHTLIMKMDDTASSYYVGNINRLHFVRIMPLSKVADLHVRDGGGNGSTLHFGFAPSATNGLDASLDEVELPLAPSAGTFDARFVLPTVPVVGSLTDCRSDTSSAAIWRLTFQPGPGGYPITLHWSSPSALSGSLRLQDEFGGAFVNVNMMEDTSYILSDPGISSLKIVYGKMLTRNVVVNAGWNMLSVPLEAPDMTTGVLFPNASSQAYGYSGAYVPALSLASARGYWLKFPAATSYSVTGAMIAVQEMPLIAGWQMVGPLETSVSVSSLTTIPAGIISAGFYGFASGYQAATVLETGKGYWIKTSQAGILKFPGGATKVLAADGETPVTPEVSLRVEDATGQTCVLYLAEANRTIQELPPLPPSGILDARYSGNTNVESVDMTSHRLLLSAAAYPIRLTAKGMNGKIHLRLKDGLGGMLVNTDVEDDKAVIITQKLTELILESLDVPTEFSLSQNYPNPFNPATKIEFALPEAARVKLAIYDVLGREVATLKDEMLEAGYHTAEFQASQLSSGLYFYRLEAGTFTALKKMLLVK